MNRNTKAIMVAGLAWGDEGKGAAVDYITRKYDKSHPIVNNFPVIVRYNGGAQAAHNVITPDGRHHTFAQFGSGMFVPDVRTHLSQYVLVNPLNMAVEEEYLRKAGISDAYDRTTIDPFALVITPFDKVINRLREKKLGHGTCGQQGIGETRHYHLVYGEESLFVGDLPNRMATRLKLRIRQLRAEDEARRLGFENEVNLTNDFIQELADKYYEWTHNVAIVRSQHILSIPRDIIFEGAQGVLLDEREDFAPHNTWTKTTFENAEALLKEAGFKGEVRRVGCLRSYMTRHGAGPFKDDKSLDFLPELHNNGDGFQGKFRRGHFDMAAAKHALDICGGVDEIHMSHLDHLPLIYPGMDDAAVERYVNNLERLLETPITVVGVGPTAGDRKERHGAIANPRRRSADSCSGLSRSA